MNFHLRFITSVFCSLSRAVSLVRRTFVILPGAVVFVSFAFLVFSNNVSAQDDPLGTVNLIQNPSFESGWQNWSRQGGAVYAESCCGQHETPFFGRNSSSSPYPSAPWWTTETWDGTIQPDGQFTQLYQWVPLHQGKHYRLSVWLFTNGMTGYIRRYSPSHGYFECGDTSSIDFVLVSCEFQAEATESQSFILEGEVDAPLYKWVVSDDWELTKIVKPPLLSTVPVWPFRPVKYYLDSGSYPTRTDIIATRWNNGVGRTVLQKTTDSSHTTIRYTGSYEGSSSSNVFGTTIPPSSGVVEVQINCSFLDAWIDPPFRYGLEAREATIGHETEHALGLAHTYGNCNMITQVNKELTWRCSTSSPTWGDIAKIQDLYP